MHTAGPASVFKKKAIALMSCSCYCHWLSCLDMMVFVHVYHLYFYHHLLSLQGQILLLVHMCALALPVSSSSIL
uniref:Uncharacterized protein n=1 Tax=Rhizophora mucronata TaxID=61149 RepID=A0A2P2IZG8_RHIMU